MRWFKSFLKFPFEAVALVLVNSRGECGRKFRIWLARRKGVTVDDAALIGPRALISGERLRIGKHFSCQADCRMVAQNADLTFGDHVVLAHHVDIAAGPGGSITIGERSSIAQFTVVRNCSHQHKDPKTPIQLQGHVEGNITIGPDCMLAASVVVLPNTVLGQGCVVGSGTVLSGTFPPYSIIAGHPGRIVGKRA